MISNSLYQGVTYFNDKDSIRQDLKNQAPHVGKIRLPKTIQNNPVLIRHGTGFFVKRDDGRRDKIITAAHLFFDENGKLRAPLETSSFELGSNLNDHTDIYNLKQIKCATSDPTDLSKNNIKNAVFDQCTVTLDRDIPKSVKPAIVIDESFVQSAGKSRQVGYHIADSRYREIRAINNCSSSNYDKKLKIFITNCNISGGMSGAPDGDVDTSDMTWFVWGIVKGTLKGTLKDLDTDKPFASYSIKIMDEDEYDPKKLIVIKRGEFDNYANK